MPWNDEAGPLPRRSEEELLALARAKSDTLARRRRSEVGGGILVSVLLLIGVTAVLLEGRDDRPTEVRTASGGSHATTTVVAATTTEPPSTTTSVVVPVLPSPVPTTTRPTTATSTTPGSTVPAEPDDSATTTTVPWVYCEVTAYVVRVTTDKPVYQVGEVVRATISVTNNADRECYTSGFQNSGASVFDAAGNNLGGIVSHGDCVGDGPCGDLFSPGTTKTATWCWSQHVEGPQPAPAGTYRMEILWQGATGEVSIQTSGLPPASTTTSNVYGIRPC